MMNDAHIFIVEDEILVARDLEQQLTALGYTVVGIAASGEEALEQIERLQPQLVLMDIRLQGKMDGIATADVLRQQFSLPVVYLTAHADQATVARARITEPFGYILKPFEERELSTVVEMALYKHQAEQKLRASERRYAMTLQSIGDGVIATDANGYITLMNPVAEKLTGWAMSEASGKALTAVFAIIHAETRLPIANPVRQVLRDGVAVGLGDDTVLQSRGGDALIIEASAAPITDDHGQCTGVVLVFHDVTARRRTEQQLRETENHLHQARKMDAIGRLAAGIAHDFNNQLTVINGYSRLLVRSMQGEDTRLTYLNRILAAGDRAEQLTHQLLAYSRRQVLQPQIINLNQIVIDTEQMLSRLIGEHIEIKIDLAPTLAQINADPTQFGQVLMNLVLNARDAMPNGGTVTISTANTVLAHEQLIRFPDLHPGPYVMLSVTDTGTGMTEEVRSQLFEPFFTTKEQGKGSGLGLATTYGIVKQSGGDIDVQSTVNHGSQFTIYIPALDNRISVEDTTAMDSTLLTGCETILVVDDEESIRNYVREILEICGYEVMTAASGPDALQMQDGRTTNLDLLLTDVVMPHMSGVELANRLTSQQTNTKVLYMSGYNELPQQLTQPSPVSLHLLKKPFTPDALADKIRLLLD